ncbi:MAG: choice-of-anchor J domain-containing protein, partial [Bacteroidales bacterium]|nr:choice-of-anchor J domain-containing protein [Bacteroidales bacterium]
MKKTIKLYLLLTILLSSAIVSAQTNLLTEGFEGTTFPPTGWTILNLGAQTSGETWMQSSTHHHTGSYSAFSQDGEAGYAMEEWLITPAIPVPANSYIEINFWHKFQWANYSDGPEYVKISVTGIDPEDFTDEVYSINSNEPTTWEQVILNNLPNYAGQTIYIAFIHTSANGLADAWVLDDISVDAYQTGATDVGILSIESPEEYVFITDEVYPAFTIKNFGTAEITDNIQLSCEIRDSLDVLAYSALSTYLGGLAVNATAQISFTGAWTPDEIGVYSVKIWTDLTGDVNPVNDTMIIETEVVQHYGTGGPDAMGYQWIDNYEPNGPEYNWIDISETGESAIMYEPGVTFAGDDNMSPPIPFGFNFPYYGIDRESFYVDTNGELLLTDNTWYNSFPNIGWNYDGNMFNYVTPIPGDNSMPALVAVFWDDLHADAGTGDVYFQTFGTAPERYCVVQWNNLRFHAGSVIDTTLCFEAIFYETGDILFQYKNVELGQTGSVCPHDNGRSSTIGIQNDTYDIGLSYLFELVENQVYIGVDPIGNLIQNETAILFFNIDNQAPFFTFDGKGNTFDNTPEVKVKIADMSGIQYDTLYYDIGNGWQAITHSNFTEPDLYTYQLPEIPNSTTVNYYFAATDNSGEHYRGTMPENAPVEYISFEILPTSENVKVLLAYSGSQDYNNIEFDTYIEAFDNLNITYDIYDWEEYDSYRITDNYDIIFMYGRSMGHGTEEDTLGLALMEFLDLGTIDNPKNIFTAADDIANNAYSLYSFNLFYRPLVKFYYAYIRGRHIPTGYGGGTDGIGGPTIYDYSEGSVLITDESVIGNANQELPTYSNSPDVLDEGDCPE